MSEKLCRTQARVVIIGGGVIGCSIAYHLTKLGCRDVVLLERAQLTSGTTWHAAGLLTSLRDTETQTRLAKYSPGPVSQARSRDRAGDRPHRLRIDPAGDDGGQGARRCAAAFTWRTASASKRTKSPPAEVKDLWPLADVGDLKAAFYFPNDARVNPTDVTQALAKGARLGGAQIIREHPGHRHPHPRRAAPSACAPRRATSGRNSSSTAPACGPARVGRMAGVNVPLQAAEHYYLISEPVAGVHPMLPILSDPGNSAYIREEAGKIMVGLFEAAGAALGHERAFRRIFASARYRPTGIACIRTSRRRCGACPVCSRPGIKLLFCGPESFTAGSQLSDGRGAEPQEFLRRRGIQFARHPLRRRRRAS